MSRSHSARRPFAILAVAGIAGVAVCGAAYAFAPPTPPDRTLLSFVPPGMAVFDEHDGCPGTDHRCVQATVHSNRFDDATLVAVLAGNYLARGVTGPAPSTGGSWSGSWQSQTAPCPMTITITAAPGSAGGTSIDGAIPREPPTQSATPTAPDTTIGAGETGALGGPGLGGAVGSTGPNGRVFDRTGSPFGDPFGIPIPGSGTRSGAAHVTVQSDC
jgi:hypothetical protein